jgi:hypothetical protein
MRRKIRDDRIMQRHLRTFPHVKIAGSYVFLIVSVPAAAITEIEQ